MKRVLVKGETYLVGDVQFEHRSFNILSVGQKIKSIGDTSKNTSSSRHDRFLSGVTYRGYINISGETFIGFEIDKNEVIGVNEKTFKLFSVINENELACSDFESLTAKFYKAEFELV